MNTLTMLDTLTRWAGWFREFALAADLAGHTAEREEWRRMGARCERAIAYLKGRVGRRGLTLTVMAVGDTAADGGAGVSAVKGGA